MPGVGAAAGDAGDERGVAHQAVHHAEDGRAQPAAGDVPVVVVVLGRDALDGGHGVAPLGSAGTSGAGSTCSSRPSRRRSTR